MVRPIRYFLSEFSSGGEATPVSSSARPPMPAGAQLAESVPGPDPLASRLQECFQQGVAVGRAKERQEFETQTAELSIDFERRLEELRSGLSNTLAERLVEEVRAGIERARADISTRVAASLVPFLRDSVTRAAMESFVAEVGGLVDLTGGLEIQVSCPREFLEPVRSALENVMAERGVPGRLRCVAGDTAELRASIDDSVVETRLADWLSTLDGVLR